MILDTDQAVSEVIGTVLMVAMVVMIAGIVAAMLLGMPFIPQKPTLASFSVEIIQVPNSTQPGAQTVPVISFYQVSGDHLAFFGPNGTTVRLTDPANTMYSVQNYGPVPATDILVGERFFIFKQAGSPGNFMATNNQSSIPATDAFTPHGTWRFAIVDEKETNMILFERDLTL
jgi:flagellin-like protein